MRIDVINTAKRPMSDRRECDMIRESDKEGEDVPASTGRTPASQKRARLGEVSPDESS